MTQKTSKSSNRANRANPRQTPRRGEGAPTAPNRACPSRDGAAGGAHNGDHQNPQPRQTDEVLATTTTDEAQSPPMARTYTDTQKADAVALYVEHGLAEAHHRTGIPKASLRECAATPSTTTAARRVTDKTRRTADA